MKVSKNKDVLIINDVTCYGKVSSLAMIPVMTKYNIHPYILPTALVSNTMDYGSSVIMDTCDFMTECIEKWRNFGFSFSNITTGLINDCKQMNIIIDLIKKIDKPFVLVDPIMADDGKLYPGMYEGAAACYRELASYADILTPNYTEATILAEVFENRECLSSDEYDELSKSVLALGSKAIVISGCKDANGRCFNLVRKHGDSEFEAVYYTLIPASFIGTGDIFSAALFCEVLQGADLITAVKHASALVGEIIENNLDNPDHFDLRIETVL